MFSRGMNKSAEASRIPGEQIAAKNLAAFAPVSPPVHPMTASTDSTRKLAATAPVWSQLERLPDDVAAVVRDLTRGELPSLFDPGPPPEAKPIDAIVGDVAKAVLLLLADRDEASHRVSQSHEGTLLYDHAHAIMHRREADFGNARYWVRRIEGSPVFGELPGRTAATLAWAEQHDDSFPIEVRSLLAPLAEEWDAGRFLDLVRQSQTADVEALETLCRVLQFEEMLVLMRIA